MYFVLGRKRIFSKIARDIGAGSVQSVREQQPRNFHGVD
jgi:hypothetical protein